MTSREARTELREIITRNFRNLQRSDIPVPPDGIVLVGDNGQGKTNFLEAVRYLTLLRSGRGARDADLIRHGEAAFFVSARAMLESECAISVGFDRATRRKKVQVNGNPVSRLSDAFGRLAAILLSPSDVEIVAGEPGERRRYMDVLLSLTDVSYLANLQRYRTVLAHRNAAVRKVARGDGEEAQIRIWDPLLAEPAALLWSRRAAWCVRASDELTALCGRMGEPGRVSLYHATHNVQELTAVAIMSSLESHLRADLRNLTTTVGPHRDDVRILLDGRELRAFGSGGQQRTAAIALRFLETLALREAQQRWPVLLLDDPFAELDARRSAAILELVEESGHLQVILAVPRGTDIPRSFRKLERWNIRGGVLARSDDG